MKRKTLIALLVLALPVTSCAKRTPLKPEAPSAASSDVAADAALGTLEEESEIRRQLKELEEKEETEKALREQGERERREEERRVHRTLTDDQILSRTT